MKEIHAFQNAIHQASHETSQFMTAHLRSEAHASGWPSHVSGNMGVTYSDKGFEAHTHDAHKEEAHDLEYGTTTMRPTAAVRRFANRTGEADTFLAGRMHKILGEL